MEVYVLILILSVVQSLFGVGLLLFGTPILLIMDYSYADALMILLPASAAISWSQVKDTFHEKLHGNYRKYFFLFCMPLLVLGMMVATKFNLKYEIKIFVIVMLAVAFIIRTNQDFKHHLQNKMKAHLPWALSLMGIIHGLSNMGGSILTPMVSSLYTDKNKVLAGVSFDYAFMATMQLIVLIFVKHEPVHAHLLIGPAISLSTRYLIGKKVFAFTTDGSYQKLLSGFILANAILLVFNL